VETFAPARDFVENPRYGQDRADAVRRLDLAAIDVTIASLIAEFAAIPHCFTLQCCYGHFVWARGQDPRNLDPIPSDYTGTVRYRIAYIAFCIEKSDRGVALREALSEVPRIDPEYIQFGSPDWFWRRWANSYALQVEPTVHQFCDEASMDAGEARHIQKVRERFFERLTEVAHDARGSPPTI